MSAVVPVPGCPKCGECHRPVEIEANYGVCPGCGHHYRLSARARLDQMLDEHSFLEWDGDLRATDPLEFTDVVPYAERLSSATRKSGLDDGVITGSGRIDGMTIGIAVMDFSFIGGSMGVVVGEKISRAMERSASRATPFIAVTASGGARMQEGLMSLVQMAKTSVARARLAEVPVPCITILTDPTVGGVMASFAASADVIFAEPGATVGFAGARVIRQATHEQLPEGFQTAEFMRDHGFIDLVVPRPQMRRQVSRVLGLYPTPREAFTVMAEEA